jgi:hypothetical protein
MKYEDKDPSDLDFVQCMQEIKKGMIGLGDLFSHKLLFGVTAIGLNIPVSFSSTVIWDPLSI